MLTQLKKEHGDDFGEDVDLDFSEQQMVNKADKKVNGQIPKAIQEMTKQYESSTSYEASLSDEKLQRLVDRAQQMEEKYTQAPNGSAQQTNMAELLAMAEEDVYERSLSVDQVLTAKANKVLSRGLDVYSKSGNISRRTTTMSGQQAFRAEARHSGSLYRPTNMIESDIQSDISAASALGSSLAEEARGLRSGDDPSSIRARAGGLSEYEERIARNKALLKVQAREGVSTEKLTNRGLSLIHI